MLHQAQLETLPFSLVWRHKKPPGGVLKSSEIDKKVLLTQKVENEKMCDVTRVVVSGLKNDAMTGLVI